jgi:hypothetical protein
MISNRALAFLGVVFFVAAISVMLSAEIDNHHRIIKLEQACHGQCVRDKDADCAARCAKAHHCPEVDY